MVSISYQIRYSQKISSRKRRNPREFRVILLIACFYLVFILVVSIFWSRGEEVLRGILSPVTGSGKQALEVFAQELHQGLPLREAISNLYGTVLAENGLAPLR